MKIRMDISGVCLVLVLVMTSFAGVSPCLPFPGESHGGGGGITGGEEGYILLDRTNGHMMIVHQSSDSGGGGGGGHHAQSSRDSSRGPHQQHKDHNKHRESKKHWQHDPFWEQKQPKDKQKKKESGMVRYYKEDSDVSHININQRLPEDESTQTGGGGGIESIRKESSEQTENKRSPLRHFGRVWNSGRSWTTPKPKPTTPTTTTTTTTTTEIPEATTRITSRKSKKRGKKKGSGVGNALDALMAGIIMDALTNGK